MSLPDKFNVTGTPEQLAVMLPVLQAIHLGFQNIETSGGGTSVRPPIDPEFDDYLLLTIVWKGLIVGTNKPHPLDKSIRLKNINPHTVSLEQLQELARKIITKFDKFVYKTGYCKVSYSKYKDGFRSWGYFDNKETGYRLFESMTDIVNKPIDRKRLRHQYVFDTSDLTDTTPDKILVAGQSVRSAQQTPIATMRFYRAKLLFPWIGHEEKLCDNKGYVIPSLDFLKAYQ